MIRSMLSIPSTVVDLPARLIYYLMDRGSGRRYADAVADWVRTMAKINLNLLNVVTYLSMSPVNVS